MHLSVFELITSFQYVGIFLLSTVCAPELIMPIVGYLAWTGVISAVGGLIAGVIGATLGAAVIYGFARTFKGEALNKLVARYGSRLPDTSHTDSDNKLKYVVLFSRFIPGVRSAMSIPAGLRKMPVVTFVTLTAAGNIIWHSTSSDHCRQAYARPCKVGGAQAYSVSSLIDRPFNYLRRAIYNSCKI